MLLLANETIPDGSELFSCEVQIAADTPEGTYPLPISNVEGSTLGGQAIPMTGSAGEIIVRTDSKPNVTPDDTQGASGSCAIMPAVGDGSALPLLGALVVASLRRRYRSTRV